MSMIDAPITVDGKEYQWILSCIDVCSRYLLLRPLYSKDTAVVSEQLLQIFADLGTPSVIQSDRGSEFMGAVERVAKLLQVKMVHSSVRHPQSQGKQGYKRKRDWKRPPTPCVKRLTSGEALRVMISRSRIFLL